jgi:hypothetical protein
MLTCAVCYLLYTTTTDTALLLQYEFCWICMGNWTEHGAGSGGYYKCNKYDGKAGGALDDAARAKVRLLAVHTCMHMYAHKTVQWSGCTVLCS